LGCKILEAGTVALQTDHRVEHAVTELGDRDARDLHRHLVQDVLEQVVRHGSRRDQTLLPDRDRLGLGLADPDREEPLAFGLPEQDDGRVRRELDPNAGDGHLDHGPKRPYTGPPGAAT